LLAGTGSGAAAAATLTGVNGAAGSGMVFNGCVFFICTAPAGLLGGSGKTVIRAVSFFGPTGVGVPSEPAGEGAGAGETFGSNGETAAAAADGGTGLAANDGGGGTALAGAGGTGGRAVGGRGTGAPAGGTGLTGPGRGGAGAPAGIPTGGRAGMLMRTVSRPAALVPAGGELGLGGKLMRTVSFLGSFESAMSVPVRSKSRMPEMENFVTH